MFDWCANARTALLANKSRKNISCPWKAAHSANAIAEPQWKKKQCQASSFQWQKNRSSASTATCLGHCGKARRAWLAVKKQIEEGQLRQKMHNDTARRAMEFCPAESKRRNGSQCKENDVETATGSEKLELRTLDYERSSKDDWDGGLTIGNGLSKAEQDKTLRQLTAEDQGHGTTADNEAVPTILSPVGAVSGCCCSSSSS